MPPLFSLNTLPDMLNIVRDNRKTESEIYSRPSRAKRDSEINETNASESSLAVSATKPGRPPRALPLESATVHTWNVSAPEDARQQEVTSRSHTSHTRGSATLLPSESQIKNHVYISCT